MLNWFDCLNDPNIKDIVCWGEVDEWFRIIITLPKFQSIIKKNLFWINNLPSFNK